MKPLDQWFVPAVLWRNFRAGGMFAKSRDGLWDFVASLNFPHYFWLGLRGFGGAFAWLAVPSLLLIGATSLPTVLAVLSGLLGSLLMAIVLLHLPFLQIHLAVENRLGAMFEVRAIRARFCRAPIAHWFALLVTLAFVLPLYILQTEAPPDGTLFVPGLVFVAFIFPAKLLCGWAVGRAEKHQAERHFISRWLSRFAVVPVIAFYVFILFFTPYICWNGVWSLLEQPAFLIPVPFTSFL